MTTVENDAVQNVRPFVLWNRSDDISVLWIQGSYTHYADQGYVTKIVFTNDEYD